LMERRQSPDRRVWLEFCDDLRNPSSKVTNHRVWAKQIQVAHSPFAALAQTEREAASG
jgi:hypothetical protein